MGELDFPPNLFTEEAQRRLRAEQDIIMERAHQRMKFETEGDDALLPAEWVARIAKHLGRAVTKEPAVYRQQLVIIGALAIAALEAHDRKYGMEIE